MQRIKSKYWWIFSIRGCLAMLFGCAAWLLWPILELGPMGAFFGAYIFIQGVLTLISFVKINKSYHSLPVLIESVLGISIAILTSNQTKGGSKMKIGNKKTLTVVVFLTCVFFSFATLASGVEPSATVSIESTSVAIGIGFKWGDGVLKFKGKEYKFSVKGLSVVDLGFPAYRRQARYITSTGCPISPEHFQPSRPALP